MEQKARAPRRSGRREHLARRAAKPEIDPCPPGQLGGRYKPLTDSELADIFDTALRLLEELGMGEFPDRLSERMIAAGARDNDAGRILFPRGLVHDAIDKAAKTFFLHGRDDNRSIEVGSDRIHFGTGGATVQPLDLDTGLYRPSTLRDLHDFTWLQDTLTNVSWFTPCCVATDVPDSFDLDMNTAYALLRNTTKPTATSFTLAEHVSPIV